MPAMPKRKPNDQEAELNAALSAIDAALPKIHKRVKREAEASQPAPAPAPVGGAIPSPTPAPPPRRTTGVLMRKKSAAQIKRTRMQFQAMSEDALLTDSGDDITLGKVNGQINGAHKHPKT